MDPRLILLVLVSVAVANGLPRKALVTKTTAGHSGTTHNLGIYDGNCTNIKQHPYLGVIIYDGTLLCACNIIHRRYCMTSADCVSGWDADQLEVILGSGNGINGQKYKISKLIIHEKAGQSELDYDIALIEFVKDIKTGPKVQIAKITSKCPEAGTVLSVAGWGATSDEDVDGSKCVLRNGTMTLQTTAFCKKTYKDFGFEWTKRMACVYNKGSTTCCRGDWSNGFTNLPKPGKPTYIYYMFLAGASSNFCTDKAAANIVVNVCNMYPWLIKHLPKE